MSRIPLKQDEFKMLQNLALGDKTTKEVQWLLGKNCWQSAYHRIKKMMKAGLITDYKDEYKKRYYKITEDGKKKLGEYAV